MVDLHAPLRAAIAHALMQSSSGIASTPSGGWNEPPSDADESNRLRALAELAVQGDAEAFGQLYDRYLTTIYRFVYYRVSSRQLAEDITGDTFVRALRAISTYRWQGKDFGAWLTTIARNLIADHYKSRRARLEVVTDSIPEGLDQEPGPAGSLLASVSNDALMRAVNDLPAEQRDCIIMRFIQEMSIAATAQVLGKSEGAVKQLQLRAVRNLAKSVSKDEVT